MPSKALRPCKQPGCPSLVESGYCDKHKHKEIGHKQSLRSLKSEHADFYHTNKWRSEAKKYRDAHLLCTQCLKNGIRERSKVTHHNPELDYLIKNNLNPYDWQYLEAVCFNCHQKELRRKRG